MYCELISTAVIIILMCTPKKAKNWLRYKIYLPRIPRK